MAFKKSHTAQQAQQRSTTSEESGIKYSPRKTPEYKAPTVTKIPAWIFPVVIFGLIIVILTVVMTGHSKEKTNEDNNGFRTEEPVYVPANGSVDFIVNPHYLINYTTQSDDQVIIFKCKQYPYEEFVLRYGTFDNGKTQHDHTDFWLRSGNGRPAKLLLMSKFDPPGY